MAKQLRSTAKSIVDGPLTGHGALRQENMALLEDEESKEKTPCDLLTKVS